MNDILLGSLFGLLSSVFIILILYISLDFTKLRLIKFKVDGNDYWEIAFDEKELHKRMNGRTGEVIMPAKPLLIRLYRFFIPFKGKIYE